MMLVTADLRAQSVVINEIQASNNSTIADEDGDFEDWIELYNTSTTDTIDLEDYWLSDDYSRPFRWKFPDGTAIPPGEFLLVWASGKDRTNPSEPLHTSFSILQSGEEILITHQLTGERDEIPPIRIPSDYSYGRYPDGTGDFFFFSDPTPGSPNNTPDYDGQVPDPVLSHPGGFYAGSFHLSAESDPYPGTSVHFTLDGSEPTEDSPVWPYSLLIAPRQADSQLLAYIPTNPPETEELYYHWRMPSGPPFLATVLRIRAFRDGAMPSQIITHTYFVADGAATSPWTLPVVSLVTDSLHLFDHEHGIYIPGKRYEDHTGSFNFPWGYPHANYFYSNEDWERPASFEFFDPADGRVHAQDVGIRIHGGMSRALPHKSFRLYARSEYGERRLEYPFFDHPDSHSRHGISYPDHPDAHRPPSYNRLILRASGQDFHRYSTMFRDAMVQGLVSHLNFDTQAYRPVILFINGEYWGIINIRERYDRHYFERNYGIDPDRLDYLYGRMSITDGSRTHYQSYRSYVSNNDLSESHHYAEIQTRLDLDNFIDYNIANIYSNNRDWPANNREYFRHQTEYNPDVPQGLDGRWRYLLIDTDYSFGQRDANNDTYFDMLAVASGTSDTDPAPVWATIELRKLLENPEFRRDFINRFAGYLNTFLSADYVKEHIAHYENLLDPVIEEHIVRWSYPPSRNAWRSHINVMRYFAQNRPHHLRKHMINRFEELEDTVRVILNIDGPGNSGHIRINDIIIDPQTIGVSDEPWPWHGIYFTGIPIELEAVPHDGYYFAGWVENTGRQHPRWTIYPGEDITITAVFEPTGTSGEDDGDADVSVAFELGQNYPNPFNNQTVLPYKLPENGHVTISVYSVDGRLVSRMDEGMSQAGSHTISIDMDGWSSGVYIVRMHVRSGNGRTTFSDAGRMTLLK